MTDGPGPMEKRGAERQPFGYRTSITRERSFGRGEILDWSDQGLRVRSGVPVEDGRAYRVRMHIERDCGLLSPAQLRSVEGQVCWARREGACCEVGIRLDQPLRGYPELLCADDFIHLYLLPQVQVETA